MIVEGTLAIAADAGAVRRLIGDVATLAASIPASTTVTNGGGRARTTIERRVGPLVSRFELSWQLAEARAYEVVVIGSGVDRAHRTTIRFRSRLAVEPGATAGTSELRYRHELTLLGPLAAFGSPVLADQVRRLEAEFRDRIVAQLAEDG